MAEESTSSGAPESRNSRGRAYERPYDDERSSVGPTDSDAESWAERERRRREEWLAGPTDTEKLDWARKQRRQRGSSAEDPAGLGPSDDEVDAWAERERRRREEWLAGPTEEEKLEWSRRQRRSRSRYDDEDDLYFRPAGFRRRRDEDGREWLWNPMMPFLMLPAPRRGRTRDEEDDSVARRLSREAVQAAEGALDLAANWPYRAWSNLVRQGRDWEEGDYEPSRPRRIRYRDDDDW